MILAVMNAIYAIAYIEAWKIQNWGHAEKQTKKFKDFQVNEDFFFVMFFNVVFQMAFIRKTR